MNYLAHLVLSQPHADSYFGNLLGDFRRGVKVTAFSESVQAGVTNHLLVDKFTDSHPAVIAAKQQVSTQRRRFAGILLDICFDHFLLVHWQRFLPLPCRSLLSMPIQICRLICPTCPLPCSEWLTVW